jgi:quercetin dioxygenase-like cupin family protein
MEDKSTSPNAWPTGPVVSLPEPFVDARGAIQTLVEGGIHSVQIISSKTDTVRANHYHKSDSHYMYVVTGSMKYYSRSAGAKEQPRWVLVTAGQMVFTPPLVEHAVHFLEDSVFLNITSEPRDQSSYEDDLVRVELFRLQSDAT